MSSPFLAEIRIFSFNFPPKGWAMCNGQLLPIQQNAALFSILGTTYGGNGVQTFALPNLQGRVPLHMGTNGGNNFILGQSAGEETHTLIVSEMPTHTHAPVASSNGPAVAGPGGNFWASNTGATPYTTASNSSMANGAIGVAGGSQPHQNLSPLLTLNICIALVGIFPSRN
jgi:microcystin-dependent protein